MDPSRHGNPSPVSVVLPAVDAKPTPLGRTLAGAGASLALHVAVGAALVFAPRPAASVGRTGYAVPVVHVTHAIAVPVDVADEFPDEPEGASAVRPGAPDGTAEDVRPEGRGRGEGHRRGDARGKAPPTNATITLGEPDVQTLEIGVPRAEVYRTLRARAAEVRRCAPPGAAFARVVVGFTVGPDGTVTEARIERSALHDAAAEACMTAALRAWTFPPAENGGSTRVTYPFVLGPFDVE